MLGGRRWLHKSERNLEGKGEVYKMKTVSLGVAKRVSAIFFR
jgi:hypothetical protein